MGKIIIDNKSSVSDQDALLCVTKVIDEGRISNEGKQYCYATRLTITDNGQQSNLIVFTDLNKRSDKFHVMDDPHES